MNATGALVTSPYLLWDDDNDGAGWLTTIDGRRRLAATSERIAMLREFTVPRAGAETGNYDLSLVRETLGAGLLVADLRAHRDAVFSAFERRFDPGRPKLGYIETTSRCPFTCVMCPKSSPSYDRENATMPMDLFTRIVDQLEHQDGVVLHLFGDPLMDRWIFERLALLRHRGLRSAFSTNAMLLAPAMIERLLADGPDRLIISCDATSTDTYRQVRGSKARFALAEPRLDAMVSAWQQRRRQMELVLRFVNLDANRTDREDFVARWSVIDGMEVDVRSHLRFPDVPALLDAEVRGSGAHRRFFSQAIGMRGPIKCTRHWFPQAEGELAVQVDGTLVPCCLAHSSEAALGDLAREPLAAIWRGERFAALRRALFMQGAELDQFPLCQRCNADLP